MDRLKSTNLEPERFRLRLNAIHVTPIRTAFPDGSEAEIHARFGWSHPVELTLPPGSHEIRLTPEVYVYGFRLEPICR